ncbi:MAG TPA: branched-chain amino acid ABC transporter permease [Ramlibacter sp.]|nr:branched-chain amino acid ABC transporter permease [Ramlibacter sp.]
MLSQQLLNGVITGSIYALFALGFTLVFSVHRLLNLAHGGVFMVGAFVGYWTVLQGLPIWIAAPVAAVVAGLVSAAVQLVALQRLRRHPLRVVEFAALITTLGADLILVSGAQKLSDNQTVRFPFGTFPVHFFEVAGLRMSLLQLVVLATVSLLLAFLLHYLYRTRAGRQVRAVASNERAAHLLGVNPNAVYFQTFFISGAMAGIAGVLIALSFNAIDARMGEPYMLRAFVIIVLGGLGSIPGCVVAALFFGLAQTLSVAYLPPGVPDIVLYSLLFLVLLVRPSGLFGSDSMVMTVGRRA